MKKNFENEIAALRSKLKREYDIMTDEYEEKLVNERDNLQGNIDDLQNEYNHLEQTYNQLYQDYQNDLQLRLQMIESLQEQLRDNKEILEREKQTNSDALATIDQTLHAERREFSIKLDNLTTEISAKDRALTTVENQKETLAEKLKQKEEQLISLKGDISNEKNTLGSKLQTIYEEKQQALDELQKIKMESERDRALKSQQIDFEKDKVKQLQSQLETGTKAYEERIKFEREELQGDFKERLAAIQKEKDHLEEKYDKKRREYKEFEARVTKEKNVFERDNAVE